MGLGRLLGTNYTGDMKPYSTIQYSYLIQIEIVINNFGFHNLIVRLSDYYKVIYSK